jgi:hypothetical protein
MACGKVMDFQGGKVGFVGMELRAGIFVKFPQRKELWAICPTKVSSWNHF